MQMNNMPIGTMRGRDPNDRSGNNTYKMKKAGYYVPGMGYFSGEPLITRDNRGERSVLTSGVLRTGTIDRKTGMLQTSGRLHKAYQLAPGTAAGDAYAKALAGEQLSPDEEFNLRKLAGKIGFNTSGNIKSLAYQVGDVLSEGLPGVKDLGGNHNGGMTKKNDVITSQGNNLTQFLKNA